MSDSTDAQITELVREALMLAEPAREQWFQELEKRNPGQAGRVRSLLIQNSIASTQVLHSDASNSSSGQPSADTARIGPYRLLSLLGKGGMGEVWLAERADAAYSKKVAIKFIGTFLGNRDAVTWFRRERQALASLEHPHIARLLDGGETEDGRPYLVMEYVDGVAIDIYSNGLSLEKILELFLQVCSAVDHAHKALIVHRDIKPANVLVTGEGQCKLLDFGIAKEIDLDAGDDGLTKTQAFTLHYASPEQMTGRPITVASDIYSLGALLYRLLSGQVLFAQATNVHSQVQAIQTTSPEKPSRALLSQLNLDETERKKRARRLQGDLDDIVLKCLRNEPDARYGSARELIEDIQRYKSHQPVIARRGSFSYRTTRWLRRNWLAVGAALALLLTLTGGLLSTAWQARVAEKQRVLAQKRFDLSRSLVKDVLFDFQDQLASVPGTIEARKQLVARTKKYLQQLGEDAQDDPDLLADMALVERRLGDISGNPQQPNIGDTPAARTHYQRAEDLSRRAVALRPNDRKLLVGLAITLSARGTFAFWDDDLKLGERAYRDAIKLFADALKYNPGNKELSLQHDSAVIGLGDVQHWNGQLNEALATYDSVCNARVIEAAKDPSLLDSAGICHTRRADTLAWLERYPEATREIESALAIDEANMKKSPTDNHYAHGYVVTQGKRGEILDWSGKKEEALDAMSKGLAVAEKMSRTDPSDLRSARNVAQMHSKRGDVLLAMNRVSEAVKDFQAGLDANVALQKRAPTQSEYQRDVAASHKRLGMAYHVAGNGSLAAMHLDAALKYSREKYKANPEVPSIRRDLAVALGDRVLTAGKLDLRCAWAAESLALWQGLEKDGILSPTDAPQLPMLQKIMSKGLACDQPGHPGVSDDTLLQ
ncbi:MAG: protein kinase domain-containing protein [Arenimonas sp.]